MTVKPASFKVQVFAPELPKPEGERLFHALPAEDCGDAIRQALRLTFPNGLTPGAKPKRLFVIVECLKDDGCGPG